MWVERVKQTRTLVNMDTHQTINTPENALRFMMAGRATVTLKSKRTGKHYTYKVNKGKKDGAPHFVNLMTGPDNENSFTYMACIFEGKNLRWTQKSCVPSDSAPFAAFRYVFERLLEGTEPSGVEVYHSGRCGACGRKLTTPESVASGIGPICAGRV